MSVLLLLLLLCRFSLEPGEIGIAVATFKSPSNASLGIVSTVSVMCRGSGYSNYAVFQLDISLAVRIQ